MNYHVAIDLGASNGKVVLGWINNGKLTTKELHAFPNRLLEQNDHVYWDYEYLLDNIITGLKKLAEFKVVSATVGIDTWGVDYVLLDKNNQLLDNCYAYRDQRSVAGMAKVNSLINRHKLYDKTGIQAIEFNTIYQLATIDDKIKNQVDKIMLVPSYLCYRLTGCFANELTEMSTTGLLDAKTHRLDGELLSLLGLNERAFGKIVKPMTELGKIEPNLKAHHHLPELTFVMIATHDTASAVAGIPYDSETTAFLSSGTWSLLGMESEKAIVSDEARRYNYTNEIGTLGNVCFLKNIIGMWMLQEVKRLLCDKYSYSDLVEMAKPCCPFASVINCDSQRFLHPSDMIEEIKKYCLEYSQNIPDDPGKLTRCIIDSLALNYCRSFSELEKISNRRFERLHIIGGGSQNELLNQLTCNLLGIAVDVGPVETSVAGNLGAQCLFSGDVKSLNEYRSIIKKSACVRTYFPENHDYQAVLQRYAAMCDLDSK